MSLSANSEDTVYEGESVIAIGENQGVAPLPLWIIGMCVVAIARQGAIQQSLKGVLSQKLLE